MEKYANARKKIGYDVFVKDCKGDKSFLARTTKTISRSALSKSSAENINSTAFLIATPNPFKQTLSIFVKTGEDKNLKTVYILTVLNASGATLATKRILPNTTLQLNTAAYPAGVYLLNLKSSDGVSQSLQVVKINK